MNIKILRAGTCYGQVPDDFHNISRCKDEHNSITTAGEPEVHCPPEEKTKVAASVSTSAYGLEPYDHVVRNLIRFSVGVKKLPLSQSMPLGPTQFNIQWVSGNLSSVLSCQGMNYTSVWTEV